MNQEPLNLEGNKMANNNKTKNIRRTDEEKREILERFYSLKDTMSKHDAAKKAGASMDTIVKWEAAFGIPMSRNTAKSPEEILNGPKKTKLQPQPVKRNQPIPLFANEQEAIEAKIEEMRRLTPPKRGKVMALIGEPEDVKSILETAYRTMER